MSIEKMSLVTLRGERAYLDEALLLAASTGYFHLEEATQLSEYGNVLTVMKEENPYSPILKVLEDISEATELKLTGAPYDKLQIESKDFEDYVADLDNRLKKLISKRSGILQLLDSHKKTLKHLHHLENLEYNFDDIFSCKYLQVRFGRLPVESYDKLHYYKDKPFVIFSYDNDGAYHWCLYLCADTDKLEIDGLFNSLYFERMRIPDYAHGTPSQSIAFINKDIEREELELKNVTDKIKEIITSEQKTLCMIYSKMKVLSQAYELRKYAAFVKGDFVLLGFIPQKKEAKFTTVMEALKTRVEVSIKPAEADERLTPPVKLNNWKLIKPFELFVDMYGLPSYKDIDPTPFVGITYILLFGLMFGDLGQGFIIFLLGLFLDKKKNVPLGGVMSRIGVSSMIFGFLYGSVFGFEELLVPVHMALFGKEHLVHIMAQETTNMILIGAIAIGILIIIAAMIMNVVLGFRKRDMQRAIFSNNGLAGLVFYVAVIVGAVMMLLGGVNLFTPVYIILFIAVPLLIMFLQEPLGNLVKKKKMFHEGVGGFVIESFFEMFEVLLSFVTNTMSFLRVGGFILSHAGMMAVVMTLAEMVSAGASPVVIIIGNIFVMGMEGLIVGIQVLRLEFYEIFSRFFDAEGKPFTPAQTEIAQ